MQVSLVVVVGKYVVINLMSSEKFQVANHRKLGDIMWLSDLFGLTSFFVLGLDFYWSNFDVFGRNNFVWFCYAALCWWSLCLLLCRVIWLSYILLSRKNYW